MDECLIWNSAWIPVAAKPFTIFAGSLAICIQTERNNRKNLEWLPVHPVSAINSPVFFSHFDFIGAKFNVNINSIRAIVSCVDKYNTTSEISPVKWLKPVRWLNQCYLVFSCCSYEFHVMVKIVAIKNQCCVQQSERPRKFADWTIENDVRDIV